MEVRRSFVNSQLYGGVFTNDNVANELSVRKRLRCKCSFRLVSDVHENCKHTLCNQIILFQDSVGEYFAYKSTIRFNVSLYVMDSFSNFSSEHLRKFCRYRQKHHLILSVFRTIMHHLESEYRQTCNKYQKRTEVDLLRPPFPESSVYTYSYNLRSIWKAVMDVPCNLQRVVIILQRVVDINQ